MPQTKDSCLIWPMLTTIRAVIVDCYELDSLTCRHLHFTVRVGKFQSAGQLRRPLPTGSSPPPAMCGAMEWSCGR